MRKVKITPTAVADEAGAAGAKEDTAYTLWIYPRAEGADAWEVCKKYLLRSTLSVKLTVGMGGTHES